MNEEQIKRFAFIVDGDVIGTIHVPNVAQNHERLWAGLSSNPIVVESTANPEIQPGWTYDGQNFIAPEN
jgi:hypothetical protein